MSGVAPVPNAAVLQLGGAVVLLGMAWPVTRYGLLAGAAPSWFAEGRAAMSAGVAGLVLVLMGRFRLPVRQDWPAVLAIGLLQLAAFFALSHAAVAWVPAGRTAIVSNATLLWAVPLSLLLGEAIPARRWAATGLGLLGIAVLAGPWSIDWAAPHMLLGHALLLVAALCWGVAMAVVRRFPPAHSMFELLPWTFGLAAVALLPLALAHDAGPWGGGAWGAMLAIGLVIAPVGTWCVMQAQQQLPIVVASVGFLAAPVVAMLLAIFMLGERLTGDLLAGAALIAAGGVVAVAGGRRG